MESFAYSIRRSERARRVRVIVDATRGVEVVLPRRAAERDAEAAVIELRPWIERRLAEVRRARMSVEERGERVPYLGEMLTLVPQRGRQQVTRRDALFGEGELLVPLHPEERLAALERFYRRAARTEIAPRLDRACAITGHRYTKLSIRAQRTRWASCSHSGAMSFNWRLLLAPEAVLDYVVWHEVCHLQVMDHSPRFWALLEGHCPDHRRWSRWLRHHGATLVLA